jgi:hypothetical protein
MAGGVDYTGGHLTIEGDNAKGLCGFPHPLIFLLYRLFSVAVEAVSWYNGIAGSADFEFFAHSK